MNGTRLSIVRRVAVGLAAFVAAAAAPASGAVMLNEIIVKGSEKVELYNSGAGAVDVNGWSLHGDAGTYVIQGLPQVGAQGYAVIDLPNQILLQNGGFIELLDDASNSQDNVWFGQSGSAPLPPDEGLSAGPLGPSLARAPDASAYSTPPASSPATDGTIWTIDFTPTLGAVNDAPDPALGSSLLLDEVDPKPVGGMDTVELYNPSPLPVDLAGWLLTNGAVVQALSGTVPGGGFLAVTTNGGFDVETNELLYLFDASAVRVDQLGFHLPPVRAVPELDVCQCYARYPDGAGPSLGYDWPSSGGGTTLLALVCTPGTPNEPETGCATPAPEPGQSETWGRVKTWWR
jgi:hypothetical protein